jgi:hypothetical protein
MKVGPPPATRGVRTPGPGLSKLNSKAPLPSSISREMAGGRTDEVSTLFPGEPHRRVVHRSKAGTEPDGMSGMHRGTACGG